MTKRANTHTYSMPDKNQFELQRDRTQYAKKGTRVESNILRINTRCYAKWYTFYDCDAPNKRLTRKEDKIHTYKQRERERPKSQREHLHFSALSEMTPFYSAMTLAYSAGLEGNSPSVCCMCAL